MTNLNEIGGKGDFIFFYDNGLLCIAILVIINIVMALKVIQDARPRVGKQSIVFLIATLACGPLGCLIWLLVRPNRRVGEMTPYGPLVHPPLGPTLPPEGPGRE